MTPFVFLAVLAAAAMHATWNALVKVRSDRFASITLTSLGMTLSAAPVLPFVDVPTANVWPWIVASVIIHIGYRLFLIRAYDHGDLAQTYPLARGTAPLITAIGGVFLLSEVPSSLAMAGILLLSLGTLLMSLRGGGHLATLNRAAVGYALTTSLCIAGYTLADGSGVRLAATAASYAAWLFVCDGLCAIAIGVFYRGHKLLAVSAADWASGIVAGFLSAAAYAIAMWAMTRAPVASVASLRETSILFAMLISVLALGEKMTGWRGAAALSIVAGVIALRMG
ncbi:MAG: EamA family transporter [Mesorhizobium sp.]